MYETEKDLTRRLGIFNIQTRINSEIAQQKDFNTQVSTSQDEDWDIRNSPARSLQTKQSLTKNKVVL